jgi:hypothetical protein
MQVLILVTWAFESKRQNTDKAQGATQKFFSEKLLRRFCVVFRLGLVKV